MTEAKIDVIKHTHCGREILLDFPRPTVELAAMDTLVNEGTFSCQETNKAMQCYAGDQCASPTTRYTLCSKEKATVENARARAKRICSSCRQGSFYQGCSAVPRACFVAS